MKYLCKIFSQCPGFIRFYCNGALPFDKIPSPKLYPIIGHAYLFSKKGPYSKERIVEAVQDLSAKYGPIFYVKFPGQEFVMTTDVENGLKLFQYEGKFPVRVNFPALSFYHRKHFNVVGVVTGTGAEWQKLRKSLRPLLNKLFIKNFAQSNHEIAQTFVSYVRKKRSNDYTLSDICSHLYRYSIECISVVCPGKRLRLLENYNEADVTQIINASYQFMDGLYGTFSEPPLWRLIKTNAYRNMECGLNVITKYIDSHLQKPFQEWENSFMKMLFENPSLSLNEARLLSVEVFTGGIDAIATTIAMTLYYLSKSEECQSIAFNDIKNNSETYLKACIKETLRLFPTAGGTTRKLPTDVVMSGYLIPANTTIIAFHAVTSRMEDYFDDALSYKPERWLHSSTCLKKNKFSSYASLPFGCGPRVCPGRWLGEQECVIFLTEILKEFILEYSANSDVGMICRMNHIPDQPINIKFVDRKTS